MIAALITTEAMIGAVSILFGVVVLVAIVELVNRD